MKKVTRTKNHISKHILKAAAAVSAVVFFIVALFVAPACNFDSCAFDTEQTDEDPLASLPEKPESEITKIADFDNGPSPVFNSADGYKNGDTFFGCYWSRDNVTFDGDNMTLTLSQGGDRYYGGEYRSNAKYGHGYYSVSMRPLAMDGVISSFFTYTNNPWDEIDIEFLGDDTTKVQFNYYTSGVGGHEYVYHLGFDASKEFHTYGFEWLEDCIIWYVDGKAVYKATKDIPVTDAQIMMNLWNVEAGDNESLQNWAGVFTGEGLPGSAQYEWIGFDSADEDADDGADGGTEDFSDGMEITDGLYQWGGNNRDHYTITPSSDKRSFRVSYNGLDSRYSGIGRDLGPTVVGNNNTLTFMIRNLAATPAAVRADVGTKTSGALTNKVTSASYTDESGEHDLKMQGGYMSPVEIAAGKTITLRLVFDNDDITGMTVSVDSLGENYASASGDLVFGGFVFSYTAAV